MTAQQHERAYALFRECCDLPVEQRRSYLQIHCAGDSELEQLVESLLASDAMGGQFLETSALLGIARETTEIQLPIPQQIGGYRVLEKLGEGGMGVVYRAVQEHPQRTVALKMLRATPSPRLIARFERETELLGRLQHPGIAQIFDAGWTTVNGAPQPYFAMEYVPGLTLAEYANTERLDHRDRIRLLIRIGEAIHHAHQQGVIHRDLKPGNILVSTEGQPKILDFGIARTVDSAGETNTYTGELLGTTWYMSPEQTTGESNRIDIRSDEYSLAIVGYQLLTGQLPYNLRDKSLPAVVQTIREEEPAPLSKYFPVLRGDWGTVFAKALEKEPDRRYASVWEFKQDLQRLLDNRPILARPANTWYQLRKFVRRNNVAVLAAGLVLASIIVGAATATWQWRRAEQALVQETTMRNQVQQESEKAQAITNFLVDMVLTASPQQEGRETTIVEAIDRVVDDIDVKFADQPVLAAQIHFTVAKLYRHLAALQKSEEQHRRALEIRLQRFSENHPDVLTSQHHLALVLFDRGMLDEAEQLNRQTLEIQEQVFGSDHSETLHTMNNLALTWWQQGRLDEALKLIQRVYRQNELRAGRDEWSTQAAMGNVALILHQLGRLDEAEPIYRQHLADCERLNGSDHPKTLTVLNNLAALLLMQGQTSESEQMFLTALERSQDRLGADHLDTLNILRNLARISMQNNQFDRAQLCIEDALAKAQLSLPSEHWFIHQLRGDLGWCLCQQDETEKGTTLMRQSMEGLIKIFGAEHPRPSAVRDRLSEILARTSQR